MANSQLNPDGSTTLVAPGATISTPGSFSATGGTNISQPSTTFDANQISQNQTGDTPSLNFPPAPNPANTASNSGGANLSVPAPIPSAENIINNDSQTTPAESNNTSLLNKVASLIGMGKSQQTLTNESENAAGISGLTSTVNDFNTQLEGLNNQATALQNEASAGGAIDNQEQQDILKNGNITTTAGLAPKTAGDLRINQIKQSAIASQSLTVKSALYGAQGKLSIAKDAADKAADAQYADQQQKLDYVKALIDANAPQMGKEEKAQAAIVQSQLADRQTQIDNAKEDKKTILAMATAALKNNPNDTAAQYAAQQALAESNKDVPDVSKAFALVGQYQSDPVATQQALANLAATRASTAKNLTDAQTTTSSNGDFAATIDLASATATSVYGQKALKTSLQNAVANKDYPSAYAAISQATANGLGGSAGTTFEQQQNSLGVLNALKSSIQAYADAGGDTNILKGSADQIQNKLGTLLTDPKYASLAVQMTQAFQNYRLQMTGAAFSPEESKEYAAILPSPSNTLDLNLAKLTGASTYLNSSIESSIKNVVGPGGVYIKQYAEGAQPSNTTQLTGPDGKLYNVPNDQVTAFKAAGGH